MLFIRRGKWDENLNYYDLTPADIKFSAFRLEQLWVAASRQPKECRDAKYTYSFEIIDTATRESRVFYTDSIYATDVTQYLPEPEPDETRWEDHRPAFQAVYQSKSTGGQEAQIIRAIDLAAAQTYAEEDAHGWGAFVVSVEPVPNAQ